MIVTEHTIRDIIATIPEVQINAEVSRKPRFHWGDELELVKFIKLKKTDSYPLIWLLPSTDVYSGIRNQYVEKDCSFVIATREVRQDLLNTERYQLSFDKVLNPLAKYLVKGMSTSNVTEKAEEGFDIFKHPNYSADSEENGTIDMWDALKLDIRVKFYGDKCIKPIYYD